VGRSIETIVIERANAMTPFRPQIVGLLLATIVALGSSGPSARAQDDADVEDRVEIQRHDDVQQAAVDQARQRLRAAYQSQFARLVTSQFRTRDGARQQLQALVVRRIRTLTAQCHLTEGQQKKLELAGRGDVKRFLDRFDHIARTLEDSESSVDDMRLAMRELQPLLNSIHLRIFSDDSLFAKTLATTLDPQQAAAREKALADKNKELHRAAIESAVNTLRTNLGLTETQGDRLEQLFGQETRPPRRFGAAPDIAAVLFQASRIPEDRIRPIFDDDQWRIMHRWMAVYIHGASGERTLRKFGYIIDDEPAIGGADRGEPMGRKDDQKGTRTDQPALRGSVP
jgi:hypothetical protein